MINQVHNIDFMQNQLPAGSGSLIIVDGPYFRINGKFDWEWKRIEDWAADVEAWAAEVARLLFTGGTLLWWGDSINIHHARIALDRHLRLINVVVWEVTDHQCHRGNPDRQRKYQSVSEHLLVYEHPDQHSGKAFSAIREYLHDKIVAVGINRVAEALGVTRRTITHWTAPSQWEMPSQERYEAIEQLCDLMPWTEIHSTYKALRRPFHGQSILPDVIQWSREPHLASIYPHPTRKPEGLTRKLILTNSNPGDLVIVPFAGSGTECAMAAATSRNYVGFEIDPQWSSMAQKRAAGHLSQQKLFAI